MYEPLVSIVMPVYNGKDLIAFSIESVLKQSYLNWELLIIDDGSVDSTYNVVKKYLNDSRIRYFYKDNGGQGSARNIGIKKASGKLIAFLDADDLWDEEKLETQIEVLINNDADLVYTRVRRIDANGKYLGTNLGQGIGLFSGFKGFLLLAVGKIMIPNLSVITKKECIVNSGNFDESDSIRNIEDYELWFRMFLNGYKIFGLDQILGSYRIHNQQSTHFDAGSTKKMIAHLKIMSISNKEHTRYYKYIILSKLLSLVKKNRINDHEYILNETESLLNIKYSILFKVCIVLLGIEKYLYIRLVLLRRLKKHDEFISELSY